MTIFLIQRIFKLIFCIELIYNEQYNYYQKEEVKEPQNEDDFLPKEKDRQSKWKMSRELHNIESYIKQGKSLNEIYKSNLVSLSRSTVFERCKRYKKIVLLKESLVQKKSIFTNILNIY